MANVGEILAVSKHKIQKSSVEIFNLKTLSELKVRKQYHTKIANRFAAVKNVSDKEKIDTAWENVKENINPLEH